MLWGRSLSFYLLAAFFAAYVLCLLLALLTVGSLSDYVGRRPAILAALTLNVFAMILFMTAGSAAVVSASSIQRMASAFCFGTNNNSNAPASGRNSSRER